MHSLLRASERVVNIQGVPPFYSTRIHNRLTPSDRLRKWGRQLGEILDVPAVQSTGQLFLTAPLTCVRISRVPNALQDDLSMLSLDYRKTLTLCLLNLHAWHGFLFRLVFGDGRTLLPASSEFVARPWLPAERTDCICIPE